MPIEQILILAAIPVLSICSFLLGYDIAETRERKAKRILDANLRLEIRKKQEITSWVRAHWPTEWDAYHSGHFAGYQQGVLQAPDLEEQGE